MAVHGTLRHLVLAFFFTRSSSVYDAHQGVESARLYGNIDKYAYWYVDLLVGTPPQRVSVILDTGSTTFAFPCVSCGHCGKHLDPLFDFGKSSTARWAACDKDCRSTCRNDICSYYQGYTEGSSISGSYFDDFAMLGDALEHNPPVKTRMGCHSNENKLFYTQTANGILGVAPVHRGSTLLDRLFRDTSHVHGRVLSICLAEWGGRLKVGGYNSSYAAGDLQWIPLTQRGHTYSIQLANMQVDGKVIDFLGGRAREGLVDTGTTYTYMASKQYHALRSSIESYCASHNCGATLRGTCWQVAAGLQNFPSVEVSFEKAEGSFKWEPNAYLYRKGTSSRWCYSFENDGTNAATTLGASWMLHKNMVFDLEAERLGFVEATCPESKARPSLPTQAERSAFAAATTAAAAQEVQDSADAELELDSAASIIADAVSRDRSGTAEPKTIAAAHASQWNASENRSIFEEADALLREHRVKHPHEGSRKLFGIFFLTTAAAAIMVTCVKARRSGSASNTEGMSAQLMTVLEEGSPVAPFEADCS
eukprot:TRINITY_DN32673_c0_g1_i1.p1 TRINITY_DN32673_c0_g1~~TRINITY_DN32673_c0_g1_i1.p1  ORF type:complete len:545 (+),score=94.75 TRINITY_DN32673_c0_g1_i1:29-1636(+)